MAAPLKQLSPAVQAVPDPAAVADAASSAREPQGATKPCTSHADAAAGGGEGIGDTAILRTQNAIADHDGHAASGTESEGLVSARELVASQHETPPPDAPASAHSAPPPGTTASQEHPAAEHAPVATESPTDAACAGDGAQAEEDCHGEHNGGAVDAQPQSTPAEQSTQLPEAAPASDPAPASPPKKTVSCEESAEQKPPAVPLAAPAQATLTTPEAQTDHASGVDVTSAPSAPAGAHTSNDGAAGVFADGADIEAAEAEASTPAASEDDDAAAAAAQAATAAAAVRSAAANKSAEQRNVAMERKRKAAHLLPSPVQPPSQQRGEVAKVPLSQQSLQVWRSECAARSPTAVGDAVPHSAFSALMHGRLCKPEHTCRPKSPRPFALC